MFRAVALLALSGLAFAQVSFEVASVKVAAPLRPAAAGNGPKPTGFRDDSGPGRASYRGASLRYLLEKAYGLPEDQIAAPGWMESERYDVEARAAAGTSPGDRAVMLQNLLRERFRLQSHWEERKVPSYELRVAAGGAKMARSKDQSADGAAAAGISFGPGHLEFARATMAGLATGLTRMLAANVVDMTELPGRYDVKLGVGMEEMTSHDAAAFGAALKEEGLRLERLMAPGRVLVIDAADKVPTAN